MIPRLGLINVTVNWTINTFLIHFRLTVYGYTRLVPVHKDFDFLECLLFGSLISATDPGMSR